MFHSLRPLMIAASLVAFTTGAAKAATVFQQISPTAITYVEGTDFNFYDNSGVGPVEAQLLAPSGDSRGCLEDDFTGFTAGRIALVLRGLCSFRIKQQLAVNAGAVGLVVVNNAAGILMPGTFNAPVSIPSLLVTQEIGEQLVAGQTAVRIGPAPIPTPAALPLLGAAMLTTMIVGRRRRRRG